MNALQGTREWELSRAGCATASEFHCILPLKNDERVKKTREAYKLKLALERITGEPNHIWLGDDSTDWGHQTEPLAVIAYEHTMDLITEETGFIRHPRIMAGASPDRLIVGASGGLEIKCPFNSVVHVQTLTSCEMPTKHKAQVMGGLWVTEREWWDFTSYDPRLPENMQQFITRIYRDEPYIRTLDRHVRDFLEEVEALTEHLKNI